MSLIKNIICKIFKIKQCKCKKLKSIMTEEEWVKTIIKK